MTFLLTLISLHIISSQLTPSYTLNYLVNGGMSFLNMIYIKIAYFSLLSHIILRQKFGVRFFSAMKHSKRHARVLRFLIDTLLFLNFLLIGICNPSLLNPGPSCLTVSYQNVQGLVPFSYLSSSNPKLDQTKIFELNAYLHNRKPDVLVLNETWLKKSIKDNEIIENPNYNVYRNDRSQITHPTDPNNPKKFRKNGGGVLIAVRANIEAEVKRISMRKGARSF